MRVVSPGISFTTRDLATAPPPHLVARLVEEVLLGDNVARARFYEAFSPVVKGFIRKWQVRHYVPFGFQAFDDEDAFQTVMIRLIYGDRYATGSFNESDSPLYGWLHYDGARSMSLYRFVQRNVNHYLRDLRRNSNAWRGICSAAHAFEGAKKQDVCDADAGLTEEQRAQLRRSSRHCWKQMNPFHREVLEQVGVMGISQAETARKMGVSEATVSRWLRDATKKLRDCLEYSCPEELLPFRVGRH